MDESEEIKKATDTYRNGATSHLTDDERTELEAYRACGVTPADLIEITAMLGGTEYGVPEELRRWADRCAWHCEKVTELSKKIEEGGYGDPVLRAISEKSPLIRRYGRRLSPHQRLSLAAERLAQLSGDLQQLASRKTGHPLSKLRAPKNTTAISIAIGEAITALLSLEESDISVSRDNIAERIRSTADKWAHRLGIYEKGGSDAKEDTEESL